MPTDHPLFKVILEYIKNNFLKNIIPLYLFFYLVSFSTNIHLTLNMFRIKYLNNVGALKRNPILQKEILMATKKKAVKKKAVKKKAVKKKAVKKKAVKKKAKKKTVKKKAKKKTVKKKAKKR